MAEVSEDGTILRVCDETISIPVDIRGVRHSLRHIAARKLHPAIRKETWRSRKAGQAKTGNRMKSKNSPAASLITESNAEHWIWCSFFNHMIIFSMLTRQPVSSLSSPRQKSKEKRNRMAKARENLAIFEANNWDWRAALDVHSPPWETLRDYLIY